MKEFYKFFVISGSGWLLDVLITMSLVQFGITPFWASMMGAGTAVTFVYMVSLFVVFQVDRISGLNGYIPYVLWQIFSIALASALVAVLTIWMEPLVARVSGSARLIDIMDPLSLASGIAKALITPLTLVANFLFMRWLTGRLRLLKDRA